MKLSRMRISSIVFPLALISIPLAVTAPVLAAPSAKKMMKRMDSNRDRKISRDEWLGPPKNFARFDANNDGFLTFDEIDGRLNAAKEANTAAMVAPAERPPWTDVHVHPSGGGSRTSDFSGAVKMVVKAMDESGMRKAVLMPTPQGSYNNNPWVIEDFARYANKYPGKFVLMGGGGSLNLMIHADSPDGVVSEKLRQKFRKRAEEILALGAVGFGEMSILHVSLVHNHQFESVAGDHPLLLLLADIAAEHDVVIDVHFDPIPETMPTPSWLSQPPNPSILKENLPGFERLLAHNRKAKIVWAHAASDNIGTWGPELTRQMLEKHPNLYMSIRMAQGRGEGVALAHFSLSLDGIKPGWLQVFKDFPDRFVLGGDQFFSPGQQSGAKFEFSKHAVDIRHNADRLMSLLPKDLAQKIGYENAARLYKIE